MIPEFPQYLNRFQFHDHFGVRKYPPLIFIGEIENRKSDNDFMFQKGESNSPALFDNALKTLFSAVCQPVGSRMTGFKGEGKVLKYLWIPIRLNIDIALLRFNGSPVHLYYEGIIIFRIRIFVQRRMPLWSLPESFL